MFLEVKMLNEVSRIKKILNYEGKNGKKGSLRIV